MNFNIDVEREYEEDDCHACKSNVTQSDYLLLGAGVLMFGIITLIFIGKWNATAQDFNDWRERERAKTTAISR